MNNKMNIFVVLGLAGLATAGCAEHAPRQVEPDTRVHGERFLEPGEMGHAERIDVAQQRAGARADASLHGFHFDRSGGLNSLGEEKLAMMLAPENETPATTQPATPPTSAAAAEPMVIYVDTPDDDRSFSARKDAVARFATAHGWTQGQIDIRHGTNREMATPTASLLSDKEKAKENAAEAAKEDLSMKMK